MDEITLHCLSGDDVNDMVSTILGERIGGNVGSLSDFLFRITHGSKSVTSLMLICFLIHLHHICVDPLLVRQQIISLFESGFIWLENERLMWDVSQIEESNTVSSSLTNVFCSKINTLPEACKRVLMVCLK